MRKLDFYRKSSVKSLKFLAPSFNVKKAFPKQEIKAYLDFEPDEEFLM